MSSFIGNYLRYNRLSRNVSIQQRIMEHREQYNTSPLIIIDLMYYDQLGGYLHRSSNEVKMRDLCGMSRQRLFQLENFVAQMKRWGAKLIFITNGPFLDISGQIIPDEDDSKGSSKDWRYAYQCGISDYLVEAHYSRVAADARFIPIERIWTESVAKIARRYGKILWSWDNTRHQEIAKYASVHEALAIISKNYALLMYSGLAFPRYKLWSLVDSNEATMETEEFDPLLVRRTLRLSAKQLRLLGAFVDYYNGTPTFANFLERMKIDDNKRSLFNSLANYVKKSAGNLQELDYLKFARDLFGEERYIEKFDELKSVCESYNVDKILLSTEQNNDSISMQLKKQDSFNYDIYHGIKITISITFVDYRYWQLNGEIDLFEIFMTLYQRISGVLLQHKNDPQLVRYVNIKRSHEEEYGTEELIPDFPKDFVVPSLEYMFEHAGLMRSSIPDFNLRLLRFITGLQFGADQLEFFCKTDQRSQLQDSVTLRYMVSLNMLTAFEADIFLVTMHKCRLEPPYNLPLPEELNLRAFHLYFTYIKLRTLIKHSFYTAGLDDSFMDECYLDGVAFQTMFQKWSEAGASDEFRYEVDRFKNYRLY